MDPTRRSLLAALALAGCAGEKGTRRDGAGAGAPGAAGKGSGPAAPPPPPALAALRAAPLPADAEPAYVFRAGAVRPGGR